MIGDGSSVPPEWWLRIGHDLRGPIAPMRMAVQLLRSGRVPADEQDETLKLVDRQIDALLAGIDDISELIRLVSPNSALNMIPGDLNLILDLLDGRAGLRRQLNERKQVLTCVPTPEPVMASHDPSRLALLMEYLIGKCSEHSAVGAQLWVRLEGPPSLPRIQVSGAGASLIRDTDLRFLMGLSSNDDECSARPMLMRQIARMSHLQFASMGTQTGICFSLPGLG